jgi:MFS transporter, DHA3 family, macrolide efflux protein
MSFAEGTWGIGMLLGGAAMGICGMKINRIILINIMYLLLGFTTFISGILSASGFYYFVILNFFWGIFATIFSASFTVVMQTTFDSRVLGRVSQYITHRGLRITNTIWARILAKGASLQ